MCYNQFMPKIQTNKKPLVSDVEVTPWSHMEDFQLIIEAVDFKLCKKNFFKTGKGAETLHIRLQGHYTKDRLDSYGRNAYWSLRHGPKYKGVDNSPL
jgi:hypothetical protein